MFSVITKLFDRKVTFESVSEWDTDLDDRIDIMIGDTDEPWELNRVYLIADEGKRYVAFYNESNVLETHELGVKLP